YGVGVVTGRVSDIIAVDIDEGSGKNGAQGLERLQEVYGPLPHTLTALTPSGGRHLIFNYPKNVRGKIKGVTNLGDAILGCDTHVDIRADGNQINVAPTRRGASAYVWHTPFDSTVLADLPPLWIELLQSPTSAPGDQCSSGKVPEGKRNDMLMSYVCKLIRQGMGEHDLLLTAHAWNEERCEPPLARGEVDRCVRGLYARYASKPATNWDEIGNADWYVARNKTEIRYTDQEGWLTWRGDQWKVDTKDVDGIRRMKGFAAELRAEMELVPDPEVRKSGLAWARKSASFATMSNALKIARSSPEIAAHINDFDKDPVRFAVKNAVIDLTCGGATPHSPDYKITRLAPVSYDPEAKAPLWERFLDQTFAGNQDLIRYMQTLAGYFCTGLNIEHSIWVFHGGGRNGKGVLTGVLRHVLGPNAQSPQRDTFVLKTNDGIPADLAALRAARLCIADEFPTDKKPNEELLKQISGGDPITARHLYKDPFTYHPTYKLILVTNKRLPFSTNFALWERLREIPFLETVAEKDRNPNLKIELQKEASGILNWMIRGAETYFRDGLQTPASVKAATEQAHDQIDSVKGFKDEMIIDYPGAKIGNQVLYDHYTTWCKENGHRPVPSGDFKKELETRFGLKSKRGAGGNVWHNIAIAADADEGFKVDIASILEKSLNHRENRVN
ncbi:phage/plasmid primase, P4 family, partial [Faunimonas sp. B44]|uniref:phage/plasmid primase, P4 family n=1 Tax=Faunimonas sp. B44 TaxID=3461493 RepID=UPI004043BFA2